MSRTRWTPFLLAMVWLVLHCRGADTLNRPDRRLVAAEASTVSEFRGSGSCSATACHGSIAPRDSSLSTVLQNEHTTWLSDDAHSRAYQVLFDPRSERIVRNLAVDPARVKPAHRDERCLACHTTPRPSSELKSTRWMDSDGVGCESCHGGSGRWLGPHTTIGWRNQPWPQKEALGMVNTQDLVPRARQCAGCHVGAGAEVGRPVRDVNHDLIAAGHPRLIFELSAYLDNMPPHWVEKGDNATPTAPSHPTRAVDFPARAWAIGRLAAVKASLDLLQSRIDAVDRDAAPWPEFSEYGCFSCHHDLRDQPWRRAPRPASTSIGSPRWGSWTFPLVEEIVAGPDERPYLESLRRLSDQMEKAVPDAKAVRAAVREAASSVDQCLRVVASRRFRAEDVQRLIGRLDREDAGNRDTSWDEATQRYLALVPLRQSWIDLAPGRIAEQDRLRARLERLREHLVFPDGLDSPKGFEPGRLPSGLEPRSPTPPSR
jgi:Cytochrome c554 and c-prime